MGDLDNKFNYVLTAMLQNYGTPSTGLHGPVFASKYYVGGNYFILALSMALGLSIEEIILYGNIFFIIPILVAHINARDCCRCGGSN